MSELRYPKDVLAAHFDSPADPGTCFACLTEWPCDAVHMAREAVKCHEEMDPHSNHYTWFMPTAFLRDDNIDEWLDALEEGMRRALTDPFVHDTAQSILPLIAAYHRLENHLMLLFAHPEMLLTER